MTVEAVSSVPRKILNLAFPMAISQGLYMVGIFLCVMMLSHLGEIYLAASSLIFSTQMTVMIVGTAILFSGGFLIGHAYGAKDFETVGTYVQQSWVLAALISIPIICIFWNIDFFLKWLGQPVPVIHVVKSFFKIYAFGVLPFSLSVCNQQLYYGTRQAKLASYISIMGICILLMTSQALIFGHYGFPALGIRGLAFAMISQLWFSFLATLFFACVLPHFKDFKLFKFRLHNSLHCLTKMFKVGWPMIFQMGGELLFLSACTLMIGWLGITQLAAYQIVNRYLLLFWVPAMAFSQSLAILVGQSRGSGNFHEIKLLGRVGIRLSLVLGALMLVTFLSFRQYLALPYLNKMDPDYGQTFHTAMMLFGLVGFFQVFDGLRNVMTGALRGLFDTRYPMFASIVVLWLIGVPLGYFLGFTLHFGLPGIICGSGSGLLIGSLVILRRWLIKSGEVVLEQS